MKWIQDGGGAETLTPRAGSVYLVASFPEAAKVTYDSTKISLTLDDGVQLPPVAVTSPSANPIQPRSADPGPAEFQRDVFMFVDWEPGPNTPLAIAFEVPAGSRAGVLTVDAQQVPLAW